MEDTEEILLDAINKLVAAKPKKTVMTISKKSLMLYYELEKRARELSNKSKNRTIPKEYYEEWVNLDYALKDIDEAK